MFKQCKEIKSGDVPEERYQHIISGVLTDILWNHVGQPFAPYNHYSNDNSST